MDRSRDDKFTPTLMALACKANNRQLCLVRQNIDTEAERGRDGLNICEYTFRALVNLNDYNCCPLIRKVKRHYKFSQLKKKYTARSV